MWADGALKLWTGEAASGRAGAGLCHGGVRLNQIHRPVPTKSDPRQGRVLRDPDTAGGVVPEKNSKQFNFHLKVGKG